MSVFLEYFIKFDRASSVFVYATHAMLARSHGMCGYYDNDLTNDITDVNLHALPNVYALAAYYRDTSDVRDVTTLTTSSFVDEHPCTTLQQQGVQVGNTIFKKN